MLPGEKKETVDVVGFQGAAGDLELDASGNLTLNIGPRRGLRAPAAAT